MRAATALIIIDMQKGMQTYPLARNNPQAEENILRLLNWARANDLNIVHVRHISRTDSSVFFPGQIGATFQDPLNPLTHEHVVEKNIPDAFIHSNLERWLRVRDINTLIIVGVSTENSVEATARTAGNLGFSVYVVDDACFTFDKVDYAGRKRAAQEVHDMSLANLQGEYAQIMSASEIVKALQPSLKGVQQ